MAQAVSRRPLTAEAWEIRFVVRENRPTERQTERNKNRQTDRKPYKIGSKSIESLRRFRLSYKLWSCPFAGQFLEHKIRKINLEKISNTNFKYINV
jgi:hypothetical protein